MWTPLIGLNLSISFLYSLARDFTNIDNLTDSPRLKPFSVTLQINYIVNMNLKYSHRFPSLTSIFLCEWRLVAPKYFNITKEITLFVSEFQSSHCQSTFFHLSSINNFYTLFWRKFSPCSFLPSPSLLSGWTAPHWCICMSLSLQSVNCLLTSPFDGEFLETIFQPLIYVPSLQHGTSRCSLHTVQGIDENFFFHYTRYFKVNAILYQIFKWSWIKNPRYSTNPL